MKRPGIISCMLIGLGFFFMESCQKEYWDLDKLSDEIELQGGLLAPVVRGSLAIGDLIMKLDSTGYVGEFSDGLIYLSYSDTLLSLMVDTMELVIDNLYEEIYMGSELLADPLMLGFSTGDTVHFSRSRDYMLEAADSTRVDSLFIKGGEMLIDVASSFRHRGILTLSSPDLRDADGQTFSRMIVISEPSGTFQFQDQFGLDRYFLKTRMQGDSSVFRMDYDLALINSGQPILAGDLCEIDSRMEDLGFYRVHGYIDPKSYVSEEGELEIEIFDEFPELAKIKLADPRIGIYTESSLGIPFQLEIDELTATSGEGTSLELEIYDGPRFDIPAPGPDQMGETAFGEILLNRESCNLADLLNLAPHQMSYSFQGGIAASGTSHFLLDTSRFQVAADLVVPIDLKLLSLTLEDTLSFELGEDGLDSSMVKKLKLVTRTTNELPLGLDLQLYLLDESQVVLDSLFKEDLAFIEPAEVDQDGILIGASEQVVEMELDAAGIEKLGRTRYIWPQARVQTSGEGEIFVKIYSHYTLDFQFSVEALLRLNTREL